MAYVIAAAKGEKLYKDRKEPQVTLSLHPSPLKTRSIYRFVASAPKLLATIPEVTQRLSKQDTGTVFLLTKDGITVIRRLRVEEGHKVNIIWRSQT
jgi:hypothetical protein